MTASVCSSTHLMGVVPPELLVHMAARFDVRQAHWFGSMSDTPLGGRIRQQMSLRIRHGGLELTSVVGFSDIAYGSSLINMADVRSSWMPTTEVLTLVSEIAPQIDGIPPSLVPIPDLPS